jgi:hypothetical protein
MSEIFISYARQDAAFAENLATNFQDAGYQVWWNNASLNGNKDRADRVYDELKRSSYCFYLASPDATESDWVNRELAIAEQVGLTVFPVLVRGKKETIPEQLKSDKYFDLRKKNKEKTIAEILAVLEQGLATKAAAATQTELQSENAQNPGKVEDVTMMIDTLDARALLQLDRLYIGLSSLINIYAPEPDYMGITDEDLLNDLLSQFVRQFDHQQRIIIGTEIRTVKDLLKHEHFAEARERVNTALHRINERMLTLQPPDEVSLEIARRDATVSV